MKKALSIILFLSLNFNIASARKIEKFYTDLKINGVSFLADKRSILKTFGKPEKEFRPKYECGFLSEDTQNKPFTSFKYKFTTWTGTDKEGYILEEIKLTAGLKYSITYKGSNISSQTTQAEFAKLSGLKANKNNTIAVFCKGCDDAYYFRFNKGKLQEIEYWSPC